MTTADRAQDDLQTVAAAVAAARPEPFPRWVRPATTALFAGGFLALALASWTHTLALMIGGLVLLGGFFAVLIVAFTRLGVRAYPPRSGWLQNGIDIALVLVAMALFTFVDQGAALLLLGLGLGTTWWLNLARRERA